MYTDRDGRRCRQPRHSGRRQHENGVRELQDGHRDIRLNNISYEEDMLRDIRINVDNMPYEELSALGERIGNVNTGLTEKTIMETMQQTENQSITEGSPSNSKICSICQEEFANGEDVGTLDCEHDFHTNCIKKWLQQKNICPLCKKTGLATRGKSTTKPFDLG